MTTRLSRGKSRGPDDLRSRSLARVGICAVDLEAKRFLGAQRWTSRRGARSRGGAISCDRCRCLWLLFGTAPGNRRDVPGLGTLRPLDDLELDALALLQVLAPFSLDAGGVDEEVLLFPIGG